MPEARLAERLAAFIGDAVAELGIRDDPGAVIREVRELVAEPVSTFEAHAAWPSLLTDSGVPVELSLRVGRAGQPALRCVVDVTDHRASLAENWSRYLRHARGVVGATDVTDVELWDLCRIHLDGVPGQVRSRIIHGLGYAGGGWRRGSLYFRTGWLQPEQLAARLPEETAALAEVARLHRSPVDGEVEVMGYDFVPRRAVRAKAYSWTRALGSNAFAELVGSHPDLEPARIVFEAFRSGVNAAHPRALLLQTSSENGRAQQRLFFLGHAWRWDASDRRKAVLALVDERLGVGVGPLAAIEHAAARHGLWVKLAMVAVGAEQDGPSVTFYLWPAPDGGAETSGRRATATRMPLERGVDYLLGARSGDGSWSDYAVEGSATSDAFVTAYVAAALSADPVRRDELTETLGWLEGHCPPGPDADVDVEATALAVVALARCGRSISAELVLPFAPASGDEPPEVAAAMLSAFVEAFPEETDWAATTAARLLAQQRSDGAWSAARWDDDLVATWRSVAALRGYGRSAASHADRAGDFVSGLPVPREPFGLALWLGTWASTDAPLPVPRVARALAALQDLQQPDGRWLGRPHRRIAPGDSASFADLRSIVTTATAVSALQEVGARIARSARSSE